MTIWIYKTHHTLRTLRSLGDLIITNQPRRRLDPQHPAQRRQHPPCLRRRLQQRAHLRLGQHRPQLPGKTRRLTRNQRQQPPKPPRNASLTSTLPAATARFPRPAHPKPPGPKPGQQPLKLNLAPLHPPPHQQDHCNRHRPPGNPRRHRPAQPLKGQRESVGRGESVDGIHERKKNITPGRRQFRTIAEGAALFPSRPDVPHRVSAVGVEPGERSALTTPPPAPPPPPPPPGTASHPPASHPSASTPPVPPPAAGTEH